MMNCNILNESWDMEIDSFATGARLRDMRIQKGQISQQMLSDIICLHCVETASRNSISDWETGKKLPSLQHLKFLSLLYGCSMDELVVSYHEAKNASKEQDQLVPFLYRYISMQNQCI